ncbi:MAG: hypothetical protein ABEJ42_04865 [Halobacteriaceae archaeon]
MTAGAASICLAVTIVWGIGAYSVSSFDYGIGPRYRTEFRRGYYSETEAKSVVLAGYDDWTDSMDEEIDNNERSLTVVQLSLFLSVLFFVETASFLV